MRTYRAYLERGRLPSEHPWVIHLETRSLCNSRCSFCAAAVTNPTRPPDALMPDALVEKILDELGAIQYANRLSLYNNNEPLLDKRIVDVVRQARRKLPRAYLEIKTNGLMLTTAKVLELFEAGLDMLYVNDYVTDGRPTPRILQLAKELGAMQRFKGRFAGGCFLSSRVVIATRQVDQVLNTRAGTAPNQLALPRPLRAPCFRPFEMMTVNPDGRVAVCSDDVYFKTPMGNVNERPLMEIWHSPQWQQMRQRLLDGQREAYQHTCYGCDNRSPKVELMRAAGVPLARAPLWSLAQRFRRVLGRVTGHHTPSGSFD